MTNATYTADLKTAIARSRSHNEIVSIEVEAADISEVLAELGSIYDGEIDNAQENDGSYGVWSVGDEDGDDWRLLVTVV